MLEYISKLSALYLFRRKVIKNKDLNIYTYGFELLYSTIFIVSTIIIIGFVFRTPITSFIFLLYFYPIRLYSGGFHCSTYLRCYLCTNCIFIMVLLLINILPNSICSFLCIFLPILSTIYLLLKAPVINKNQPLSKIQLKRTKKKMTIILIIECFIILFLFSFGVTSKIILTASLTMGIVAYMVKITN